MDLTDAHVIVTGASRGIGEGLAAEFAARGARLSLLARSAEALEGLAARIGGVAVPADLTDPAARASALARAEEHHGPVDVLVNNAGVDAVGALVDISEEALAGILALNLHAPLDLTRRVLPGMLARERGHIVNISSLAGVACIPGIVAYGATKAALTHSTHALRVELRGTAVRTTIVEVGIVDTTDMTDSAMGYPPFGLAWRRFVRLGVQANTDRDALCRATVRAVERGRRHVRRPRRAAPLMMLPESSRRMVELMQGGLPTGVGGR